MKGRRASLGVLAARFALAGAGLGFGVFASEAGLRLLWPQPLDPPREELPQGGLRLPPGATLRVASEEFEVELRANRGGHHDVEHATAKPAGARRLAVLGDSFVEAVQVPLEQTFCRRLERLLRSSGVSGAEVLNLGSAGAGTGAALLALEGEALAFSPDLVLLVFAVTNDVYNNSWRLEAKKEKPFFALEQGRLVRLDPAFTAPVARPSALRALHLVRLLVRLRARGERLGPGGVPVDFGVFRAEPDDVWTEAWVLTEALLHALDERVRAAGAGFAVAILPDRLQVDPGLWDLAGRAWPALSEPGWDLAAPQRRLGEICARQGLSCLDLLPELRARAGSAPQFFPLDGHLAPAGHESVAELLAPALTGRAELAPVRPAPLP